MSDVDPASFRQAAAQFAAGVFESAHVIALPAVERNGDLGQPAHGSVGIDAQGGESLAGRFVSGLNTFS